MNTTPNTSELATETEPNTLVTIESGPVQGDLAYHSRRFIGIPYAEPPVGALRWKPPHPVNPWTTQLDATGPGVACVQPTAADGGVPQSEDCLKLNLFAPREPTAGLVPVLVWLHDGDNTTGSANDTITPPALLGVEQPSARLYDGAAFRDFAEREVVIVTVNYRLGALGFLAHPALTRESRSSGNYGLLDQQAALAWVQENIAAFGGDPNQVTLFGHGSGATDVCHHLVAPSSAGLFHAAVLENGTCGSTELREADEAEAAGVALAAELGCAHGHSERSLDCLRAKPASDFALPAPVDPRARLDAHVIIDGRLLTEQPRATFAASRDRHVPLIVGNNDRAGARFLPDPEQFGGEQYHDMLERWLGTTLGGLVESTYAASDYASASDAARDLLTDALYACPARRLAAHAATYTPVHLYEFTRGRFAHEFEVIQDHRTDLLWFWNVWPAITPYAADEVAVSIQLRDYLIRLVDHGDVNLSEGPQWPRPIWPEYESTKETELVIGGAGLEVRENLRKERCEFWDSLTEWPQWSDELAKLAF